MSRHFTSGSQSTGASASVLPMNIQSWFPLELPGLISLQSKGHFRIFSSTTVRRHQFFVAQPFLLSSSGIHMWLVEKPSVHFSSVVQSCPTLSDPMDRIFFTSGGQSIVGNVMSLLFNTLCRFVISFLPRSKHLLISCSLKHSPLEIMESHCTEYCDLFWISHIFFPTVTTKVLSILPQISTPPLIRYQMHHVVMPEKLKYSYISVLCLTTRSSLALCTPWTVALQALPSMGILQARILEWVAMPSYKGSS